MATLTEKKLRKDILEMLKDADLSQLSAKKVRKGLEEKHKTDLSGRKKEIDSLVMELLNEIQSQDDSLEKNGDEGSQSNGASGSASENEEQSDESDFEAPVDTGPKRKKKVKGASPKKAKKSSTDEAEDEALDDEALARKLQQEESGGRRTRNRATPKSKTPKEDKPKRKTGNSTYSKPCLLSEDLANIMGKDKMPRKDIVKRMWEIVKERNLQDPSNRQFMICDAELLKVFGRKRVKTFGMMKHLSSHIYNAE